MLKTSIKEFIDDDMPTYASALAYQILFSIFPFAIFLVALISTLHLPDFMLWLRQQAAVFLPAQAFTQVNTVLDQLQQPQGGLLSLGAVIALWTASAAVRAIMNAFNAAYGVKEERPWWVIYPLSLLYTVLMAVLLMAAAALLLIGPKAMNWLAGQIGIEKIVVAIWAWLRWPVAVLLLSMTAAIVYYAAPAKQPNFRFITPGAVLSVLIWIVASLGFSAYVGNFGNYNAMYGSIGSIIVLLLYFFISSAVLLFGAEMNAVIERHSPDGFIHEPKPNDPVRA
ncbi:YihY/virulence factor BrkB family protein [Noviherbaspirillum galbum]|uniref:YihY/virulence factor BrkB family protein n=1 Tax=Noviherbaspirillum galbum TaxID=2709383 RepID=UPI001F1ACADE|nr:YihY/virulence factor BrkB family protein [Noviherbaspirillum galbum]